MTPIVAPLQQNDHKQEVANLERGLSFLVERQVIAFPSGQVVANITGLKNE
ncbi:MAG: hypothetical protein P0120_00620 [Nitrospira sp.]|nr:hypothetical protein [Nitrospira sp.]